MKGDPELDNNFSFSRESLIKIPQLDLTLGWAGDLGLSWAWTWDSGLAIHLVLLFS